MPYRFVVNSLLYDSYPMGGASTPTSLMPLLVQAVILPQHGASAGVVAMGMEKINFFWYVKNILWIALLGFVLGYLTLVSFEALHVFG